MTLHAPETIEAAGEIIAEAFRTRTPLVIEGGATRSGLGRPVQAASTLSTRHLTGITLYEPAELVIAALAGTPVQEIEATLASRGQRLAFEPVDHRAVLGTTGTPTIGGIAATNASGPGRIAFGAARDAMIGLRFVNGRGESVMSGGRVMKNVTGLDFVKTLAGSYGTLGVMMEVFLKVQPMPPSRSTLVLEGLEDRRAIEALTLALGSPFEPTGAAHIPALRQTLIRLEGFPESLRYREAALARLLDDFGRSTLLDEDETAARWSDLRELGPAARADGMIWRLSVPPSAGAKAGAALRQLGAEMFYDWGGSLILANLPSVFSEEVHAIATAAGGHATLIRADAATRNAVAVFAPAAPALGRLQHALKASFDPAGILNPGKMKPEL